jgi:hypothetical protein
MAPDGDFRALNAVRLLSKGENYTFGQSDSWWLWYKTNCFEVLIPALVSSFEKNSSEKIHYTRNNRTHQYSKKKWIITLVKNRSYNSSFRMGNEIRSYITKSIRWASGKKSWKHFRFAQNASANQLVQLLTVVKLKANLENGKSLGWN